MSLSSTINKVVHSGNGATTEWPFSFPVLEADHLAVILTDVSGVETTLSPTLYGIAGIGSPSGGAVAELVGIECGVVSGVFNLELSGIEVPDWRPRHDKHYHEA